MRGRFNLLLIEQSDLLVKVGSEAKFDRIQISWMKSHMEGLVNLEDAAGRLI